MRLLIFVFKLFFCISCFSTTALASPKNLKEFFKALSGTWSGTGETHKPMFYANEPETFSAEMSFSLSNKQRWVQLDVSGKLIYKTPAIANGACTLTQEFFGRWQDKSYFLNDSNLTAHFPQPDGEPIGYKFEGNTLTVVSKDGQSSLTLSHNSLVIEHFFINPETQKIGIQERYRLTKGSESPLPLSCTSSGSNSAPLAHQWAVGPDPEPNITEHQGRPFLTLFQKELFGYEAVPRYLQTIDLESGKTLANFDIKGLPKLICPLQTHSINGSLLALSCYDNALVIINISQGGTLTKIPIRTKGANNKAFLMSIKLVRLDNQTFIFTPEVSETGTFYSGFDISTGKRSFQLSLPDRHFQFDQSLFYNFNRRPYVAILTGAKRSFYDEEFYLTNFDLTTQSPVSSTLVKKGGSSLKFPQFPIWSDQFPHLPILDENNQCYYLLQIPNNSLSNSGRCISYSPLNPYFLNSQGQSYFLDFTKTSYALRLASNGDVISSGTFSTPMATEKFYWPFLEYSNYGFFIGYHPAKISDPYTLINLSTGQTFFLEFDPFNEGLSSVYFINGIPHALSYNSKSGQIRAHLLTD